MHVCLMVITDYLCHCVLVPAAAAPDAAAALHAVATIVAVGELAYNITKHTRGASSNQRTNPGGLNKAKLLKTNKSNISAKWRLPLHPTAA